MFKKNDVKDINNLTPMQEGMLYVHMMNKDNHSFAYFEQFVLSVTGSIDTALFEKAFNKVIEKYDVLRTVFLYKKVKKPVQVVLKQRKANIDYRDISGAPEQKTNNLIEVKIQQDKKKNFDLEKDILMRLIIIKTAPDKYKIIWSHHHMIMDGWCLGIIISDFIRFYHTLKQGGAEAVETAPPYNRYLKWLDRQDRNEGLQFWQAYLEGYEKKTSVPQWKRDPGASQPDQERYKYIIAEQNLEMDEPASSSLNRMAKENDVTINTVFQVIWGILLQRYNNTDDVVFGAVVSGRPAEIEDVETMVGLFINTVPVRITIKMGETFLKSIKKNQQKSLLTKSYEYLPLADIQARSQLKNDLLDHIMVFENYPVQERVKQASSPGNSGFIIERMQFHEQSNYDFNIIVVPGKKILVKFSFNTIVYKPGFMSRVVSHVKQVADQVIRDPHQHVNEIDIMTPGEKQQLLYEFNHTGTEYLETKTIHELFAEQAERTPRQTAVCAPVNPEDIFTPTSCFKKNPYIFQKELEYIHDPGDTTNKITFTLLKTQRHNSVVVNSAVVRLLDLFDGQQDIRSIYSLVEPLASRLIFYPIKVKDILEITHQLNGEPEHYFIDRFEDFLPWIKRIYRENLIFPAAVHIGKPGIEPGISLAEAFPRAEKPGDVPVAAGDLIAGKKELAKARVLLLGDTPGTVTTGILYLGAYLKRNGVSAYCRFHDPTDDYNSMKIHIEELLEKIQPELVAISLKWFPYIARVLDICKIIKDYSNKHAFSIKVVVGGNTASYYWQEMIQNDTIDYIIRGDGEEPLLAICKGAGDIPNCVYKKDGKILANPITYVQDECNSPGIYLSHLEEILLSKYASLLGTFFIYTHKGCVMNCFYCGGCNRAQQETFQRKKLLRRGINEVRRDIMAALAYTSTFQFDLDIPGDDLLAYCQKIWEGIDLSGHFCIISSLLMPPGLLVELAAKTFKYVYWDLDVLTLSQRHRNQLFSLGLVKPQPSDKGILAFFDRCEIADNIEIRVNLITGLPYFTEEDIKASEKLLAEIMNNYSCFGELHWARLHAQPGAPIIENAEKYHMYSYASCFADFLACSEKDFHGSPGYPGLEHLNYPYIYYKDDELNSQITRFYYQNNKKVGENKEKRKQEITAQVRLSYKKLDEKVEKLAAELRKKGVTFGSIVGLMVTPSLDIPIGILAILKAGGAYLPIDPEFPRARIEFMLKDSMARILVSGVSEVSKLSGVTWNGEILHLSDRAPLPTGKSKNKELCQKSPLERGGSSLSLKSAGGGGVCPNLQPVTRPSDLAYIIYTSGTTGKPKGVMLTHENLVNYVNWFTKMARLTGEDKTMLNSSFAFDLGYSSIYPSLLNGGELHILPKEVYLLASGLLNYIKQNQVTYIKATPSLFTLLVNHTGLSSCMFGKLRLVVLGGEPINPGDIKKFHDMCSHIEIMNHYGPTEAAIGCIAQYVDFHRFEVYEQNPTIGNPINNTRVSILDRNLKLLPVGVSGELYISGTCLARGYLNRPQLTAEKFDHDLWDYQDDQDKEKRGINKKYNKKFLRGGPGGAVFSKSAPPGRRRQKIYQTGDLARWLPDGVVEFLGRIDNQVKIRGYRIELEEIEKQLVKHPQIEDAVVIDRESGNNDKYLCAYYVPQREKRMTLLSRQEETRYERQMLLEGWGIESQEKLKQSMVFVAGAGGGASSTIMQLALAGFGTIIVCDYDQVELSNLNRQFLHDESRIGMNKALSARITINKINPYINVVPITEKLTRENVSQLVGDSAVIFDMFDDLAGKFILSEYAAGKGIPHIISAMTDISSYAALFHPPKTPCFHCIFDKDKWEELISGMKTMVKENKYEKNPLPVAAPSLFVSTGFAVNEAIKIILGIRNTAYNKFFFFNQGGTENIGKSEGFRAMTYVYSRHFRQTCQEQGFDWDKGWRGNFLEEFDIKPNPDCPLCKSMDIPVTPSAGTIDRTFKHYPLSQLREYLLQLLPEYMIPWYFVQLQAIPLTPNGKIDKKALPDPFNTGKGKEHIPPRNEIEDKLVEIWSEVLGIEKSFIGIDDNFFDLGGHSLKVTILVSRIQNELNQSLALSEIFTTSTVRKLAERLEENKIEISGIKDENLVLLRKGTGTTKHLFLIHAGSGEVDGYVEFCNHLDPQFNYWGIKTSRIENDALINITLEEVASKYIKKIKKIQTPGPYFIAGWCIGGSIAFEMVRQIEQQDEKIGFFALVNTSPPQLDTAKQRIKFTFESELSWVLDVIPGKDLEIKEKISRLSELGQMWSVIVDYLEASHTDLEVIRKLYPKDMADAVPNFEQLGIRDLIYYLNTIRTFNSARNAYVPPGKNKTAIHFFGASQTELTNRHQWNNYCIKPFKFYEVSGDHFSIFQPPQVNSFARIFNNALKASLEK